MQVNGFRSIAPAVAILVSAMIACNLPGGPGSPGSAAGLSTPASEVAGSQPGVAASPFPSETPTVVHVLTPSSPGPGKVVYDVESQSTAPERRAPYGDSYDINRLERPFEKDMTYVSDLDIETYTVAGDSTWWYVSLGLIGSDPNNSLKINYGVELDRDHDGFGDDLILAHGPFSTSWDTLPVQIYQDKNHDTAGRSAEKSDAPISTDGYETLVFGGGPGDPDPDMAWVRANAGPQATIQFAFKKSWSGVVFMLGVFADAGLKDPGQLDYVDRFEEAEAGSPVKDKQYYPLGALFLVDNVCREAFGFNATGYEPQVCPRPPSTKQPRTRATPQEGCQEPYPGYCGSNSYWVDTPTYCGCSPF